MKTSQKTWVELSKSALLHNVRVLSRHAAPAKFMAVVKANAYGHGVREVSGIVKSAADWFGVDSLDEALFLRKNGIRKPILIIGYIPPSRIVECAKQDLSFVAYNQETLRAIKSVRAKKGTFKVHLKIETGTTRQGLDDEALLRFAKAASRIPSVQIEGVYTHFANIEDTKDPSYAFKQLKRFRAQLDALAGIGIRPKVLHSASSAATILYPETHFNLVRPGIAMYGHWPSPDTQAVARKKNAALQLKPVLTWKTVAAQVKSVKKGTPVSYGLTERVSRDSKLVILPIGYWDGYDRGLSSNGHVLIRGHRCKVMGRVCMNIIVVDATDVPGVTTGDEVVLIGKQKSEEIRAEDIASLIGTIQYEVLARINPLIERRIVS